jgi:NADP oxidoreductase coenzyme F420-dependent
MNITVIGSGNMGSAFARQLSRAGHKVRITGRDLSKAQALANQYPQVEAYPAAQALGDSEVVIVATAYADAIEALRSLGDLSGKVVIDITNPLTPDYMGLTIGHSSSAAEEIAKAFPNIGVWGATEQKVHLSPAISSQRHNPGPSSPSLLDSVLNYGDRVGSWVENPRGGCYEIPKTTADSWCDSAVIHRMGRERERPFNRANRRYARQG